MHGEPSDQSVLGVVQTDLNGVWRVLMSVVAGTRGKGLIDDLVATVGGTPADILRQALYADCLRVVQSAVMADGVIEDREIDALYEIIAAAARHLAAGPRSQYAEFTVEDRESARAFLDHYAGDPGPFGRGARLRWPGLTLCRRAAELGEREALLRYSKTMTAMTDEACRLGGVSTGDSRRRGRTEEIDELRHILASEATGMAHGVDRRVQAFLAPCRVFSAVQQASSIYENDPFDVEAVHRDARVSFEQLVAHAATRPQFSDLGQMLVVLGDSGAGKTHVLRGFRRHVHEGNRGFVVYAQLQSRSDDYERYLLFHLVQSLSRRYSEQSGWTGLRELANGLLRLSGPRLRQRIQQFADDAREARGSLAEQVNALVDDLVGISALTSFDRDLLRVLLYALRSDPRTTSSVYKYLQCDAMNDHDRRWIGDVTPRTRDDDPHRTILDLARFAAATQRAMVFMVDQVDLAGFEADSTRIFRRAIDALYRITSECRSAVAVIACLSDLYSAVRSELNRPAIDRLENSPPIARLQVNRSYAEIEAVVARRLSWLFAEHGTVHRSEQAVYPIPESELRQLENRRLRDVLEWCHQFQAQCAAAGKIINADEPVMVEPKSRELDLDAIAGAWSEATQATDLEIPDEEDEILAVVAEAAKAYVHEMGLSLVAPPYKNGVLRLRMSRGDDSAALAVSVVNRGYQGGAFPGQVDSLRKRARGMVPIAVRTLEFPRGRACDRAMGQLHNARGRGAYLDASTLRALVAFQRFQPPFAADRFAAWKLRDRPISSLPAVIEIFDFERSLMERSAHDSPSAVASEESGANKQLSEVPPLAAGSGSSLKAARGDEADEANDVELARSMSGPDDTRTLRSTSASHDAPVCRSTTATTATTATDRSAPKRAPAQAWQIWVGNSTSLEAEPVMVDVMSLVRHVAIVDGVGSGRIAALLSLVEQAIERGVPAIILDRTGEMSGYARPDWWQHSVDPARARRLADQIDVRLFTPGILSGRPLSIAVVPDLSRALPADHDLSIRHAVGAVAAAMATASAGEAERLALLTRAIAALARRSSQSGLIELIGLIESGSNELNGACGDEQLRQGLIDDLSALLGNADVFTPGAEPLNSATLVGPSSGRVPLSIINTSFLGDGPRLQAWVSQLLGALSRELASSTSSTLRTVLALDGADLLLPAGAGKAAAKEPLLALIKRSGAIGLGVVLASQSPAAIDYKRCTDIDTWFVGKTDAQTLEKMKALFKHRPIGHRNLTRESGRLTMLFDDGARDVVRAAPLLPVEPIGAHELKALAARTHPRLREAPLAQGLCANSL
jgi:hypothetical protein